MNLKVWESEWLSEYIEWKGLELTKVFVDCGAGDGTHQSISHKFIMNAWNAILIDGLQTNVEICKEKYAHFGFVKCEHAILSDKEEFVYFEENKSHWSLSKVVDKKKNKSEEFKDGCTNNCKTSKLSTILNNYGVADIGILSLDLEGFETKVLEDLLFNNFYPEIIVIEANEDYQLKEHKKLLLDLEVYVLAGGILPNYFYVRKDLLEQNIRRLENYI